MTLVPLLFVLGQCNQQDVLVRHLFRGETMGTTYTVQIVLPQTNSIDNQAIQAGIQAELDQVNRLMSNWEHDSDVSRFNRHDTTAPMTVDRHTSQVIQRALVLAEKSGGALDITLSPLVDLWGFGPQTRQDFPTNEQVSQALETIGWRHLSVGETTLGKTRSDITVNLSAIAKGYGVDRVGMFLKASGYHHYAVEVGGEVITSGHNAQAIPWRFAIERPDPETRQLFRVLELTDIALATSGDYRNHFLHEGRRYSHIIDPRSGYPVTPEVASVSVLAADCMTADGLATAIMVLGTKAGLRLVESMHGVECLIIEHGIDGRQSIEQSSGMASYLAPEPR